MDGEMTEEDMMCEETTEAMDDGQTTDGSGPDFGVVIAVAALLGVSLLTHRQ